MIRGEIYYSFVPNSLGSRWEGFKGVIVYNRTVWLQLVEKLAMKPQRPWAVTS